MPKTTKIAISLPEEVLTAVETEREESGESRSQFFRRAVELLLRQGKEREQIESYIKAYQQIPESSGEIAETRHTASKILGKEPW
jgi:metal-responsive CopG/Arc/MetJ family transcriptional regulator